MKISNHSKEKIIKSSIFKSDKECEKDKVFILKELNAMTRIISKNFAFSIAVEALEAVGLNDLASTAKQMGIVEKKWKRLPAIQFIDEKNQKNSKIALDFQSEEYFKSFEVPEIEIKTRKRKFNSFDDDEKTIKRITKRKIDENSTKEEVVEMKKIENNDFIVSRTRIGMITCYLWFLQNKSEKVIKEKLILEQKQQNFTDLLIIIK